MIKNNINHLNFKAMKKLIRDLVKGEYFTLTPLEEPKESQVWVKGEYERRTGKYSTYKFSDINQEVLRNGDKVVYTDFIF